jgi:hypothetical protein
MLVTLIGQGVTLPTLISRLGVAGVTGREEDQLIAAQVRMAKSAQANNARLHTATHHLLDRLMDVERAELQRMRNSAFVDGLLARRLQRDLDLLRLRDRI